MKKRFIYEIRDLKVKQTSDTSIKLIWSVDEGLDKAQFDVRMSETRITEATWDDAIKLGNTWEQTDRCKYCMEVGNLEEGKRYWFAIRISGPEFKSKISVSVANKPQSFDQIDVWQMCGDALNARNRRLMEAIMPDFIGRVAFEYVGTSYLDRAFESCPAIERLKDRGALLGCGFAYPHYTPYETITGDADRGMLGQTDDTTTWGQDAFAPGEMLYLDFSSDNPDKLLIAKAKRLIDLGFDAIEFDLASMNDPHHENIYNRLKEYARSIDRTVYITGNGDNIPGEYEWDGVKRFTFADFALRQYPRNWDGARNHIPYYIANVKRDGEDKPSVAFVDCGPIGNVVPKDKDRWPAFYRISEAELLAAGILPGSTFLYCDYIGRDNYVIEMNIAKFIRENRELFHNLFYVEPSELAVGAENVYTNVLGQKSRTLLHLVNGNYSYENNSMAVKDNFIVKISLSRPPTRIWMTTPDLISKKRRQILDFTYRDGVASIEIPRLEYHDIVVIEHGPQYNPVYSPMKILFPFPVRKKIPVGNKTRIYALQTEGHSSKFDWYVGGILGGSDDVGVIDANGNYTAPMQVPKGGVVTIKARSQDDPDIFSEEIELVITEPHGKLWKETFAGDAAGGIPSGWEIVDGRGDWQVNIDENEKVLHEYNLGDGMIPGIIAGGDQNRRGNYNFTFKVKVNSDPIVNMNMPSQRNNTYFEMIFGYKDENEYYSYRFCYDNTVRLYRKCNEVYKEIGLPVNYGFPDICRYYDIRAVVGGDSCSVYSDGRLIRSDNIRSDGGGIGFSSARTDIFLKDITIRDLN